MYSFDSRVRYSEVGEDKKLTLDGIINYFQDSSTFQSEELEIGVDMLEKLQSMNGKRVGIISHVEGLKERIAVQVKVRRIDQTRSTVEVVDSRI